MKLKHGSRYETNGWTVLSIKGTASERGYAHGYLIAPELKEIFKMLKFNFLNSYGYSIDFICDAVSELFKPQIIKNYPELYEEMEYIAKGATANGTKISVDEIITWNCYTSIDSMVGYFHTLIPANDKLREKYGYMFDSSTGSAKSGHGEGGGGSKGQKDHCTAFMAVGDYTKDGKIVCAHNSFDNFIDGQYFNIMLDITPSEKNSNRILMQAAPGWISSGTDYYVTSNGFICTETTIGGFIKFTLKDPICCRIRQAMQYAKTLDECTKYITTNNSGDYANSWLIGDTNTNTIMRIELGLQYVNIEKKTNGYFIGYNAPEDPRIRNLECVNTGYDDIRRHQGARRVRLTQFMEQYKGQLDLNIAKEIVADHYDVYLNKINPCSRTCCSHYELDDRAFMSQSDRPKPYQLRGALDGIVCDTTLAKKMSLIARWGSSCGTPFEKAPFFKQHIQWRDQEPYIKDRPYQPWTEFSIDTQSKDKQSKDKQSKSKNKTKVKIEKIMKIKKGNQKTKKVTQL
jgi:hypothetical protein